jgi:hypothetical protein
MSEIAFSSKRFTGYEISGRSAHEALQWAIDNYQPDENVVLDIRTVMLLVMEYTNR